jgi:uncharacterized membrane protein YkvA (DUF1232 family)
VICNRSRKVAQYQVTFSAMVALMVAAVDPAPKQVWGIVSYIVGWVGSHNMP